MYEGSGKFSSYTGQHIYRHPLKLVFVIQYRTESFAGSA